jgi:hypothetical protein
MRYQVDPHSCVKEEEQGLRALQPAALIIY